MKNFVYAVAALALLATPSHALNFDAGGVDISIDTTVSIGVSQRVAERKTQLLPARNGGPKDMTVGIDAIIASAAGTAAQAGNATQAAALTTAALNCGTASAPSDYAKGYGSTCMYDNSVLTDTLATFQSAIAQTNHREHYNYDGSINTDDGRLNFDKGDAIGGVVKLTADIEARFSPQFRFFTRVNSFHDTVLSDDAKYERSQPLDEADELLAERTEVLDAYLDAELSIGNNPLLIRIGKQVINWGEATFILGGNSVFNPINVPAFRRPGSEIKEALLPVEAVYASLALSESLSLEAYAGGWDKYRIDPGGSPFANSDAFELGNTGNGKRAYVGAGAFSGSGKRNCMETTAIQTANTGNSDLTGRNNSVAILTGMINDVFGECETDSILHFATPNEAGNVEKSRQSIKNTATANDYVLEDSDLLVRVNEDLEPKDGTNSMGLALRWYSESLGSTEFGLFFQRYASRIPYASMLAYQPIAGPNVTVPTNSSTIRGATAGGCLASFAVRAGAIAQGLVPGATPHTFVRSGQNGATNIAPLLAPDVLANTIVADPTGVAAAQRALYEDSRKDTLTTAAAAHLALALAGSPTTAPLAAFATKPTMDAIVANALVMKDGSIAQNAELGCITTLAQATGGALLPTGASTIVSRYQIGYTAEYPEDIDVIGLSFNTTIGTWGVQGELAVRNKMPLQLDTDSLTVAAISASCAWENFNAVADIYYGFQTIKSQCGDNWQVKGQKLDKDKVFKGYVEEEVINFDIGTTATYTRSNSVIGFLGADLGILLTELGIVHAPNIDDYILPNSVYTAANYNGNNRKPRLANLCTSGSDLPLGGVFSLDPRATLDDKGNVNPAIASKECRPTETSSGIVLLTQLQYNNVFGTALGLRPTMAYQRGVSGRSPSPAGSFIEGNSSLSFSIEGTYQESWSGSLGVTIFEGEKLYNPNIDRDFASFSLSYAF